MNIKKINRILQYSILGLGAAFVVQLGISWVDKPEITVVAAWKDNPKTLARAKGLASRVVEGTVLRVERANDLVVTAPGEPGGVDRIAMEVVTLKVDGTLKGTSVKEIKIARTVGLSVAGRKHPPANKAPKKPRGGKNRPAKLPTGDAHSMQTVNIHDDPPYKKGEKYLLFSRKGPNLRVKGKTVQTSTVVNPTARFKIDKANKIQPTKAGFGSKFKNKSLKDFRSAINKSAQKFPRFKRRPISPISRRGIELTEPKVGEPEAVPLEETMAPTEEGEGK